MLCKMTISDCLQKIRDGRGRTRKFWPNVRYADTLDARDQRRTPATRLEIKFDSEIWIDDYAGNLYLGKFFKTSV